MKSGRAFISAISHFVRIDLSALSEIRVPKSKVPMAGLEPARAFYGPTDFKSVASAISPHRHCVPWSLSILCGSKTKFAMSEALTQLERSLELQFPNPIKGSKPTQQCKPLRNTSND